MLRDVYLLGELGKKFGKHHQFAINTPAEAVRALCANFNDFENAMVASENSGIGYKVIVADEVLQDAADLHAPSGRSVIKIVPVIGGAKRGGIGGILLGGALIAASFYLPVTPLISGMSMSYSSIAFSVGISLALGGVSQMLAPSPKSAAPSEKPGNNPSYGFNGPVNTTAQGQAVPYAFGAGIIGSQVISGGVEVFDSANGSVSGASLGFLGGA